jgi:phosphoserine phosphatase RsbU/P
VRQPTLYFATSGNFTRPEDRWLRPVLQAWPGTVSPVHRQVHLEELLALLEGDEGGSEPLHGVVLAAINPAEPPAVIDRLLEALARRTAAGVVLAGNPDDWRLIQRHGVIFEPHGADPARLAAMLFALMERQPALRLLAHEVTLVQRFQGGIRDEMERLQEELHLAAAIQRDFASAPVPEIPGLDVAVLYRPMSYVSGDVYSVRHLGDGRAEFFLADAVGHGVPAALLTMILTSSLLASTADRSAPDPASVLSRLNTRLCQSCLGSGRFVTALYGVIDAASRSVTLAGAGHPLPILLSASASSEIETQGPLLGVFEDAEFDQRTFTLDDDQTLLLYTDGLDGAFPLAASGASGATLKRDRWIAELARALDSGPGPRFARLLGELQHRLDIQTGSLHHGDDVTAVCVSPRRAAA